MISCVHVAIYRYLPPVPSPHQVSRSLPDPKTCTLTTPSATAATMTRILRRVVSQEQTMWQDWALWQDQRNSCYRSHGDVILGLVTAPHPVGLLRRAAWRLRTRDRAEGWTSFSRRSSSCVGELQSVLEAAVHSEASRDLKELAYIRTPFTLASVS